MSEILTPTARTTIRRLPKRAVLDRDVLHSILDEGFLCHLGYGVEGQPFVIPTLYGRSGDAIYLHGSSASRTMKTLAGGIEVCVSVTLVDGLVLARSMFHHSMNYRSVVIFGQAHMVEGEAAKLEALRVISEHVTPGRWSVARQPSEREVRATMLLRLPIEEASVKVRTGPPVDEPEDMEWPVWAGTIPVRLAAGAPVLSPDQAPGFEAPLAHLFERTERPSVRP